MAIFDKEYIINEYAYKYNNSNDDEDDDDPMSYKKATQHLTNSEIRRAREVIQSIINKYPKIKKSANQIDLYDNEGDMDDNGEFSSPIQRYKKKRPSSYIKLIDGDLLSGYPDFKSGSSEEYSDDLEEMKKAINDKLKSLSIPAVFVVGNEGDEEDISYGIRSIKKNN